MEYNVYMKTNKTTFAAVVELPYGGEEVNVKVELDKDETSLTYDEVTDAIYNKVAEEHGCPDPLLPSDELDDEDFPRIVDLVIYNADDGEYYPVISESMDDSSLKDSIVYTKYLVLPDATYSLTPECKLWMELKQKGIIDEDAPFDYEKYHQIVSH